MNFSRSGCLRYWINVTRQEMIGVASSHTEQFAYIHATDINVEIIARYFAICALT